MNCVAIFGILLIAAGICGSSELTFTASDATILASLYAAGTGFLMIVAWFIFMFFVSLWEKIAGRAWS